MNPTSTDPKKDDLVPPVAVSTPHKEGQPGVAAEVRRPSELMPSPEFRDVDLPPDVQAAGVQIVTHEERIPTKPGGGAAVSPFPNPYVFDEDRAQMTEARADEIIKTVPVTDAKSGWARLIKKIMEKANLVPASVSK